MSDIEIGDAVSVNHGGQFAVVVNIRNRDLFVGLVECDVRYPDGVLVTCANFSLWVLHCKNCHQRYPAHTDSGKCLYGPGNWEAP